MESNQTQSNIRPTPVEIPTPVKHRGGKRPGSGRKPGRKPTILPTVNPAAPLAVAPVKPVAVPDMQAITARKSPLERLYEVMANGRVPWSTRVRAMGLAAEYVHAKQPQAIHVTQDVRLAAVVVHTMPGPWEPKSVQQTHHDAPTAQLEPICGPLGLPEGCNGVPKPNAGNNQPAFLDQKQGVGGDSGSIQAVP